MSNPRRYRETLIMMILIINNDLQQTGVPKPFPGTTETEA